MPGMPTEPPETRPHPPVKQPPVKTSPVDLSIQCPECGTKMQPEHAHYRCLACGYRDSCCM
jgi:DNA-directed RNA polymerase subunit RPC12/RpoP